MRTIFLVGEPACGKTALMLQLLQRLGLPGETLVEGEASGVAYPETMVFVPGIYNGHPFAGTDRLALHTQPQMIRLLDSLHATECEDEATQWTVLLEGDRYATPSFCKAAAARGPLTLVYLEVPEPELQRRREQRGSNQNPIWIKGRKTKLRNLGALFPPIHVLNGDLAGQEFALHMLEHLLDSCECREIPSRRILTAALPVAAK